MEAPGHGLLFCNILNKKSALLWPCFSVVMGDRHELC